MLLSLLALEFCVVLICVFAPNFFASNNHCHKPLLKEEKDLGDHYDRQMEQCEVIQIKPNEAFANKNKMKERYDEARLKLMEATIEIIKQNDKGMTARELADESGMDIHVIVGIMQSLIKQGLVVAKKEEQKVEYVRLNCDKNTNMNNKIISKYVINRYFITSSAISTKTHFSK